MTLQHKFIEIIPDNLEQGILYISISYCTAIHKCVCGCGNEVVTPIAKDGWKLTFDGKSITLYPSIGNWKFDCRSHYWITSNEIIHARKWSSEEIEKGHELMCKKKKKKKWITF